MLSSFFIVPFPLARPKNLCLTHKATKGLQCCTAEWMPVLVLPKVQKRTGRSGCWCNLTRSHTWGCLTKNWLWGGHEMTEAYWTTAWAWTHLALHDTWSHTWSWIAKDNFKKNVSCTGHRIIPGRYLYYWSLYMTGKYWKRGKVPSCAHQF